MIRQFHEFCNLIFGGFLTFGSIMGRRAGRPTAGGKAGDAAAAG